MKSNLLVIHGLNQLKFSFRNMLLELENDGYSIHYFSYSNKETIPEILMRLRQLLEQQGLQEYSAVTMSLGAIILRNYLAGFGTEGLNRAVMIGPPNRGAMLLRAAIKDRKWRLLLGRLIEDFLDHESDYLPLTPEFIVGIIAGTKAKITKPPIPLFYVNRFFDTTDSDGKVKIEETKIPFMKDFVTVNECHDSLLSNPEVIHYTKTFLSTGRFDDR